MINVTVKIQVQTYCSLLFSFYYPRFFLMCRGFERWHVDSLHTVKQVEGFFPRFSLSVHKKYSGGDIINVVPNS